jgi:hypothetical protein
VGGLWGRGIDTVGEDEGMHWIFVWDMENSFLLKMMKGMEKDVHTWYVILMEDG